MSSNVLIPKELLLMLVVEVLLLLLLLVTTMNWDCPRLSMSTIYIYNECRRTVPRRRPRCPCLSDCVSVTTHDFTACFSVVTTRFMPRPRYILNGLSVPLPPGNGFTTDSLSHHTMNAFSVNTQPLYMWSLMQFSTMYTRQLISDS